MAAAPNGALPLGPKHHGSLKVEPTLLAAGVHAGEMPGNVALGIVGFARTAVSGVLPILVLDDGEVELLDIRKGPVSVLRLAKKGAVFGHLLTVLSRAASLRERSSNFQKFMARAISDAALAAGASAE